MQTPGRNRDYSLGLDWTDYMSNKLLECYFRKDFRANCHSLFLA